MVWLKSFGVGLIAVLIAIPVGFVVLGVILKARSGLPSISIDVVSLSRNLLVRVFVLLVFALGFLWEYRRLARR
jgi:ethanolamine transporter EutH